MKWIKIQLNWKLRWIDQLISQHSKNRVLARCIAWLISCVWTKLSCGELEGSEHYKMKKIIARSGMRNNYWLEGRFINFRANSREHTDAKIKYSPIIRGYLVFYKNWQGIGESPVRNEFHREATAERWNGHSSQRIRRYTVRFCKTLT